MTTFATEFSARGVIGSRARLRISVSDDRWGFESLRAHRATVRVVNINVDNPDFFYAVAKG